MQLEKICLTGHVLSSSGMAPAELQELCKTRNLSLVAEYLRSSLGIGADTEIQDMELNESFDTLCKPGSSEVD